MARSSPTIALPDWLRPHLQWITLPSWLLSVLLHGMTLAILLVVSRMPGCQPDMAGENGAELRAIGLYVRPDPPSDRPPSDSESESDTTEVATTPSELPSTVPTPEAVPRSAPVPLNLPSRESLPILGAGGPPRAVAGLDQLLSPARPIGGGSPAAAAGGGGTTSLFGIQDSGRTFVYLIDSSSSMDNYGAMRVAKAELQASLERLTPEQQFQVIFSSSQQIHPLDPGRFDMFFGTDSQRIEARLQIAAVTADGGTDHNAALDAALALNADVIFYLTDAGEPPLLAGDLARIKQRNGGNSRIHCIEFGQGDPLTNASGQPVPNFLTRLAEQNNGRYTYRNVRTFGGR
ncbi:MAG: hypothetical protein R3B90_15420 [Planctomycetaceae bacterium]